MSDTKGTTPALESATPHDDPIRHMAPHGAMQAALAMGVQYRTNCGEWRWPPTKPVRTVYTADDLAYDVCCGCAAVFLASRRGY